MWNNSIYRISFYPPYIDELNGAEFDHKQISVNVARPREERPSNGGNRDRRGGYNSRRY